MAFLWGPCRFIRYIQRGKGLLGKWSKSSMYNKVSKEIKAKTIIDEPVMGIDWMPTFSHITGSKLSTIKSMEKIYGHY